MRRLTRLITTLPLTPREQEIYDLCVEGLMNKEIAQRLNLGCGAIKGRITQILAKKGFATRCQLIVAHYKAVIQQMDKGNDPST